MGCQFCWKLFSTNIARHTEWCGNRETLLPQSRIDFNRKALYAMAALSALPCNFENNGKHVSRQGRQIFWKIKLLILVLYSLYMNITLLLSFVDDSSELDHQNMGLHINRGLLSATFTFWAYELFIVGGEDTLLLYNFAQSSPVLDSGRLKTGDERSNMQDLLLAQMPFMAYSLCPFMMGMFLMHPTASQFVFSLMPAAYQQSFPVMIMMAAGEFYMVMMWMAVGSFGAYHKLTLLKVIEKTIVNATHDIKMYSATPGGVPLGSKEVSAVSKSVLAMSIFNISTARVVFAHKINCLLGGVFGMFFFIRLILTKPVVSFIFWIHLVNCVTFYTVMWGYVHTIPDAIDDFKKRLSVSAQRRRAHSGYLRRLGQSLRPIGVQVGNFRNMERSSTLLFIDFVSTTVANLLISFP